MRECFNDTCVFITIHLNYVDERDLGFGAIAEWLQNRREFLIGKRSVSSKSFGVAQKTHSNFTEGETLDLVGTRAPVNRQHETLPDALHQLVLWKRQCLLFALDRCNDLRDNKSERKAKQVS